MIKTTFRFLAATAFFAAATVPSVAGAVADTSSATKPQAPASAVLISLNLLSPPRVGPAPVVQVRQMGSGSWICSPAGFGQLARCYRG